MTLKIKDIKKNHITLKKFYFKEVRNKTLTKIFRPGNRICPNDKCYFASQKVFIKILEINGSDHYNIEPVHITEKFPVQILSSKFYKLKNLKKKDFKGSSKDISNIETLKIHLGLIYNFSKEELDDENFEITITTFKYL